MKYSICLCLAVGLSALGCDRGERQQAGSAAGELAHGTANAARSVGHGVACGVREFGQTLSGTQGDPRAEAISEEQCRKMNEASRRAGEHLDRSGQQFRQGVERAPEPAPAVGGGPRSNTPAGR